MAYQTIGVTTVDCQKQVRSWRLLRSLVQFLIPSCISYNPVENANHYKKTKRTNNKVHTPDHKPRKAPLITGTIFGFRGGNLSLCIQTSSKLIDPFLLLELSVPTNVLAREMQGGVLRIALEATTTEHNKECNKNGSSLFSMPKWTMYCNGKKVGFALKRKPTKCDLNALKLMSSVHVGAGVIRVNYIKQFGVDCEDRELVYLRVNFERVRGSSEAESFHLIDPDGNIGQELSISFFPLKIFEKDMSSMSDSLSF